LLDLEHLQRKRYFNARNFSFTPPVLGIEGMLKKIAALKAVFCSAAKQCSTGRYILQRACSRTNTNHKHKYANVKIKQTQ
jgi:hypothetical protein